MPARLRVPVAVLVVAGGFDEKDALDTIRKLFGPIPNGELPQRRPLPDSKPRAETVRKKFESKFPTPRLLFGFNTVTETDSDSIPLDVVSVILTYGKTSRLHRRLIEDDGTATSIDTSHSSGRYPGWFAVQAELFKVEEMKKVEDAICRDVPEVRAVQTHLEPLAERAPGRERTAELDRIERTVAELTGGPPRAVRALETDDGLVVLLTLALDGSTTLSAAHDEATVVAERIRAALTGVADVVVHTEP